HYPGWSMPALKYLFEERKVTASGHETTDTDPGVAASKDDATLETYILSTNHYQIELLANLDQVPESGAMAHRRRTGQYCLMVKMRRAIVLQIGALLVVGITLFILSRLFPLVDIL